MRVQFVLAVTVMASLATLALGQPDPGPPGRGGPPESRGGPPERRGGPPGRGVFFDEMQKFMRDVRHHTPNREIIELLRHPPIRDELSFDEDKLNVLEADVREILRGFWDEVRQGVEDRGQLKEKILETMKEADTKARALLDDEQFDRLLGLYIQQRGTSAATNAEVAERIGLSADKLEEFRHCRWKFRAELMEKNQESMERIVKQRPPNRQAIGQWFERINESVNDMLLAKLTETQRAALAEWEGEPFDDLPPHRFGWGPGGGRGPGEGRGGRGGRGGPGPGRGGPDRGNADSDDRERDFEHGRDGRREHHGGGKTKESEKPPKSG